MKTTIFSSLLLLLIACKSAEVTENTLYRDIARDISSVEVRLKNRVIAVLPFENTDENTSAGIYASDRIVHELLLIGKLSVVERSKIEKVLNEQALNYSGAVKHDMALKIGRLLSVEAIVVGTIIRKDNRDEIIVRVIQTETGLILKSSIKSFARSDVKDNTSGKKTASGRIFNPDDDVRIIPAEGKKSARLLDVQLVKSGRSLYFIGQVENQGKITLSRPDITFRLLNKSRRQLAVVRCFGSRYVAPGEKIPFMGIITPKPMGFSSYEIIYEPEEEIYFHHLVNFSSREENFTRKKILTSYELTGIFVNRSRDHIRYAQIIVSLYDKKGKFIGSANGFASRKVLSPGAESPYKVLIFPHSLSGKPASYKLHFSALIAKD